MYEVWLVLENKKHDDELFINYREEYGQKICPDSNDVSYRKSDGRVKRIMHSVDDGSGKVKKKKRRKAYDKGFSLVELIVVVAILAILVSIAVPIYTGYIEKVTRQVCNANCLQLERIYHMYLLMENKDHTAYVFDEFLQKYEKNMCPANGEIEYVHGVVRCVLHSEDEANGNDDEEDGSVPFL